MKCRSVILAGIVAATAAAPTPMFAGETAPPSTLDTWKKKAGDLVPAMPSVGMPNMPSMPSIPVPDFSRMKESLAGQFAEFTDQIGSATPALNAMGYEVTTFRVQWSLSPKAKLRLKSRNITDPDKIAAAVANAPNGLIASSIVASAAAAKKIQSSLHMGTAIIDVDFVVPPKIRMSFMPSKQETTEGERAMEDMDLACSQAFSDK